MDCLERFGRTITFAGRTWAVKEAPLPVGPGNNRFSDRTDDVWVDSEGLHLTIRERNGQWWSSEVILLDRLGYGTYVFKTRSRTDILDVNATFGLFTWDPYGDNESPGSPHREIDYEDSRWGVAGDPNTQAVVQPWNVAGNRHRFNLPDLSADARLTRIFKWEPGKINFLTLAGHQSPTGYPNTSVIDDWPYVHEPAKQHYVPEPGRESVRLNLWLNQAAPANGQTIEVVVTDFSFVPMPSSLVVDFGPQYGIWIRRGATWSQLNSLTAEAILRVDDGSKDGLVIDFGPGVGLWFWRREANGNDFWFQLNTASPTAMVGVDFDGDGKAESGVFDFPGVGLWRFDSDDGQWIKLHPFNVSHLAAADLDGDGGEELIVDFQGYGLWVWHGNGTWSQLHPFDVGAIVVADLDGNHRSDVVLSFPGVGVWGYLNGTTWAFIHPFDAKWLAAGDVDGNLVSDLVIDFGAGVGVWVRKNGTTWAQLNSLTSDGITTGDLDGNGHDEVIFDFGGVGVWSYEDVGGWQQVHPFNAKTIATGRLF
jgi:hypothetical protein